jgi:hypothetical protein
MSWLRHLTLEGTLERYCTREQSPDAYRRLVRELDVIAEQHLVRLAVRAVSHSQGPKLGWLPALVLKVSL